jgi:nucleotide-binding universal stress UspA family protein
MRLKDILVSLDPTREGTERLGAAMRLAQAHRADIVGFYGAPTVGYVGFPGRGLAPEPAAGDLAEAVPAGEIAEDVRARFEAAAERHGLTGAWVLAGEPVIDDLVERVRTVDLTVVGLGDPEQTAAGPQGFRPEDLVMRCGRPVLGLPSANPPERIGRRVILAWDGGREACRAMNDALPLLASAESVAVVSVDAPERSTAAAVARLRRHGVRAEPDEERSAGEDVGELLLSRTERLEADLLVAGAYGHSRLGEALFGGVSRTLLHQMMIPVLASH